MVSFRTVDNWIVKMIPSGKTRDQIAREASISRSHLQRIIAGQRIPSVEIALRLSAILKTPVDELFHLHEGAKRTGSKKLRRDLTAEG